MKIETLDDVVFEGIEAIVDVDIDVIGISFFGFRFVDSMPRIL